MILIISITDNLGGAEQVLFKIAKHYAMQNTPIQVSFFKRNNSEFWKNNLPIKNVKIVYHNNFINFITYIKNKQYKYVFSSHIMINAITGALRTLGILKTSKLISRESTQVFERFSGLKLIKYKLAYKIGYRNIDLLICQTKKMCESLKTNVPIIFKRKTNVTAIPNPFDFPETLLINEPIKSPNQFIVSAGRLIPEKGFHTLIRVFSEIATIDKNLHLVILGEGPERPSLEQLISELNLQTKISLIGHVDNVYPYFRRAKLCVVSSIREGFPNVLLQMMSQNTRVVSTLCAGGINELKGVITCETNNPEALRIALLTTLQKDITNERELFDKELKSRSTEIFMNKIISHIR